MEDANGQKIEGNSSQSANATPPAALSSPPSSILEEAVWEETPVVVQPVYKIDQRPARWWECALYGWQHTLVDISPFVLPLVIAGAFGIAGEAQKAQFINFCLFAMGIATLIQTTIGNRLPIIQGPSATLTAAIKSVGELGFTGPCLWGGIFAGAVLEMLIGASRILKYLRRFFPIAVAGVVVVCIGVSLAQVAVKWIIGDGQAMPFSSMNFILAGTVILMIFVLQVSCTKVLGGIISRGSIFFSIWIVGLGLAGILGQVKWDIVANSAWFSVPSFLPYGGPGLGWEFIPVAIIGIFVGYAGSMIESLGDYAATCAVSGTTYQVKHINRGIFAEGLGCLVASLLGGMPVTSYTQNIGIIATTRVASRFVVQIAAVILILYGICPKFGALLVAMPRSVLGGVFLLVCGMITISGIRLLHAAKDTTANSLMIGTTLLCALAIPNYIAFLGTSDTGKIWFHQLPAFIKLFLSNTVVMGLIVGVVTNFILNIVMRGDKK